MNVVIISDTHDNIVNLKKCLKWCRENNIGTLICCGDITNSETLGVLAKGFSGPIHAVGGNVVLFDEDEIVKYENFNYYGKFGRFKIEDKNIGLCHELFFVSKVLELGDCDIIFYGHTHKPWVSNKHGSILLNPGPLGGMFSRGTFATWDTVTKSHELKVLDLL